MKISSNIKFARKRAGLTQKQLAAKINKGFSTIQKYELGLTEPSFNILEKIATALDISPGELLGIAPAMDVTIAERIVVARKKAGLTQKELGERMGISDASIAQYESGKRNPKLATLNRIASALEVPTEELVDLEGELAGEEKLDDRVFYEKIMENTDKLRQEIVGLKAQVQRLEDVIRIWKRT